MVKRMLLPKVEVSLSFNLPPFDDVLDCLYGRWQ
jgi:hypothetical protein